MKCEQPKPAAVLRAICPCFFFQAKEPEKAIPQDTVPQETLFSEPSASKTKDEEGGEEDAWKKEQAYLKALSDQYCIEKYQDSYDLMCE